MSGLLFFIGLWLGGIFGVFIMCLFQISGKSAVAEEAEQRQKHSSKGDLE